MEWDLNMQTVTEAEANNAHYSGADGPACIPTKRIHSKVSRQTERQRHDCRPQLRLTRHNLHKLTNWMTEKKANKCIVKQSSSDKHTQ